MQAGAHRLARHRVVALHVAFLLTGMSALLYQVIWQRLLALSAGADAVSVTIVVSAFLAGLGFGTLLGSLVADRLSVRGALLLFALCNLAVAGFALTSSALLYDLLFLRFPAYAVSRAATLGVSFVVLLLPTTLMGLSLPILARAVVRRIEGAAASVSTLYGVNTVGAAAGALIGGIYLAGTLGFEGALRVGAATNAGVGAAVLLLFWRYPRAAEPGGPAVAGDAPGPGTLARTTRRDWVWFGLVTLSGFLVISLEMVWFRTFEVVFMSKAYAFAVLLALFLLFDAAGALVGARLVDRIRDPGAWFFALQGAIALAALAGILIPLVVLETRLGAPSLWQHLVEEPQLVATFLFPASVIGPPAFLVGLYFPVVQKALQTDPALVGTRTALIDLGIILGNTLGGVVTGLVLLDVLGTTGTLRAVGLAGLLFVGLAARRTGAPRRALAAVAAGLVVLGLGLPGQTRFWTILNRIPAESRRDVLVAEDASGVALIARRPSRRAQNAQLLVRGHGQGTLDPFMPMHGLLGAIGPLVHPDPRRILIVGLGSGATAYAAGVNPQSEVVEVVEIAGVQFEVLEAFFEHTRLETLATVLHDRRYRMIADDGRRLLSRTTGRWDVIEGDPILPTASGSGMLNSVEYFELVRSRLAEGGLFVQWTPTERVREGVLAVFPHVVTIGPITIASASEIGWDPERVRARLAEPGIRDYLLRGKYDVPQVFDRMLERAGVQRFGPGDPRGTDPTRYNTDLFPRDEYEQFVR